MNTDNVEAQARLKLITHNARLIDARKELGMAQPEFSNAVGIPNHKYRDIENLKTIPSEDYMAKIACFLVKTIDYLFPEELLAAIGAGVFSQRVSEISATQVLYLTHKMQSQLISDGGIEDIEDKVDAELLTDQIHTLLGSLTPREKKVVELRFGLNGGDSHTLDEVSGEFHVTRERIRQVEAKALRKLRHPTLSRRLLGYCQ